MHADAGTVCVAAFGPVIGSVAALVVPAAQATRATTPISASFTRCPEYEPILDAEVTEERWRGTSPIASRARRWRLPGIHGLNFLLRQALGGGMASLKATPWSRHSPRCCST